MKNIELLGVIKYWSSLWKIISIWLSGNSPALDEKFGNTRDFYKKCRVFKGGRIYDKHFISDEKKKCWAFICWKCWEKFCVFINIGDFMKQKFIPKC